MFKVGDVVRIKTKHPEFCWPDAPALNLEGTVAIIKKITRDRFYYLDFVEVCAKKPEIYEKDHENLNWTDEHLELVEPETEIEEIDTSTLFKE